MIGFLINAFIIIMAFLIGPVNLLVGIFLIIEGIIKKSFSNIPQGIVQGGIGLIVTIKIFEILLKA